MGPVTLARNQLRVGDQVIVKALQKGNKPGSFIYGQPTEVVTITKTAVLTEQSPTWIHTTRIKLLKKREVLTEADSLDLEKGRKGVQTGADSPDPQLGEEGVQTGADSPDPQLSESLHEFWQLISNNDTDCGTCKMKYPLLTETPHSGAGIHIYPGNYTCYRGEKKGVNRKNFTKGYCASYSSVEVSLTQNQVFSIGDSYWICGDGKIRFKLEGKWKGECVLAKAIMNIHIFAEGGEHVNSATKRIKRSTPAGSFDPHVYIDTIGVPRGVPDEFKARNQVAAGFESILAIITVNKNVDWINYIYYNQQRFVNYTRDALRGVAEQLQADSIMTFQNRMVLDMILAEKGGVCKVLEDPTSCCTFIPNNTGPNGKVTIAIQKLEDLSAELKKNSGITDPWDQYFGWFTN
ncbi:uncharacterized protein LOC130357913 [Hyla sarda]|uniref:uncharacterized protein LOC130357913 n=1 Tax=Hyla sarda TaxID=327740 RepID=UPI0024C2A3C0|nr:uncharacterized protein LOC130357913 [Hyla sarda]